MWNFDPGGMEPTVNDLPLMSNIKDIRVGHYLLDLKVNLRDKFFFGSVILFLEQAPPGDKCGDGTSSSDSRLFEKNDLGKLCVECDAKDSTDVNNAERKEEIKEYGECNRPPGSSGDSRDIGKAQDKESALSGHDTALQETAGNFVLILDSCDIDIKSVEEITVDTSTFKEVCSGKSNLSADSGPCGKVVQSKSSEMPPEEDSATDCTAGESSTAGRLLSDTLQYERSNFALRRKRFLACRSMSGTTIHFEVQPWCVRMWKDGVRSAEEFPAVVRIKYQTKPCGKSLTWAIDQDGSQCVFTQGAWINNRSLFPCQEPPGAMATWQAIIQAPEELTVLMSGDKEGLVLKKVNGMVSTLHFTDMLQPSSIVTLAIGKWKCYNVPVSLAACEMEGNDGHHCLFSSVKHQTRLESGILPQCDHEEWPCRIGRSDQPIIPSRISAPPSLLEAAIAEFASQLPKCLGAIYQLLGAHPFSRLDLLILPRCFASLGLASPSMIFLSQSLLSGNGSCLPRLAHEISHSWFGILIGARDWTEEWLSEGFATFMEDPVHALSQNWNSKQYQDFSSLRALLRFQALKTELENTESELQIMRPMARDRPGPESKSDQGSLGDEGHVEYVKNGLNPDKWFLQVHYLKGYFLLRHIASQLSMEKTLEFIHLYVHRYHGQLVLSRDIFQLLFELYPELGDKGVTMDTIYSEWLDKPGMPVGLNAEIFIQGNGLVSQVKTECERWIAINRRHRKASLGKKRRKMASTEQEAPVQLLPDQLVLLLEYLLEVDTMATATLEEVNLTYDLTRQNAEVRHRWCELVVKHKYNAGYPDVQHFLLEDQAMGVYLYGELMASEDPMQQTLARDCFKSVAMEMDRGCYRKVHEMVYGEPAEREDD